MYYLYKTSYCNGKTSTHGSMALLSVLGAVNCSAWAHASSKLRGVRPGFILYFPV